MKKRLLPLLLCLLLCLGLAGCVAGMLGLAYGDPEVELREDPAEYQKLAGPEPEEDYRIRSLDLRGDIFPQALPRNAEVREFRMVRYDPWDPQWICYLTLQYSPEDYARETERLAAFPKAEYAGVFSVTGFDPEPLALSVDRTAGFLYAIPTPGRENAVTYVRLEFGNLFYDLDYRKYIPAAYLPQGFDATPENPWREAHLQEADSGTPETQNVTEERP